MATLLLRPSVVTVRVGTNVIKSHLSLSLLGVRLEKYSFSMAALGTGMVLEILIIKWTESWLVYLRSWEGWIRHDVSHDVGDGVNLVHDLVHIDTAAVCHLSVVAVPE